MDTDIVLITIDCWRHDAVDRMPILRELTADFDSTEAICSSAATNGVFPGLLNGRYFPLLYDGDGEVPAEATPLPQLLAREGYSTGGFIASNPFLHKWEQFFDEYWNVNRRGKSDLRRTVDRATKLLLLTKEVTASEVATRAREWYTATESPRFLWMHLMEPHSPFNPGLREGLRQGLISSYRSVLEYELNETNTAESMSERTQETIEDLYWRCIGRLDDQMERLLEFVDDDATVIITGDHGEEHDHGVYAHARLYDECVRVPALVRWTLPNDPDFSVPFRHIDLAPTLLDGLGRDTPSAWNGRPIGPDENEARTAFFMNHATDLNETYVGVRTAAHKLIRRLDGDSGRHVDTELYDLQEDPGEEDNIYGTTPVSEDLDALLDEFLTENDVLGNVEQDNTGVSPEVEDRLEELGYM